MQKKTVAQTTFKTHLASYLRAVHGGEAVVRVKDQAGSPFMVVCLEDDAPDVFVSISVTEAKGSLSDVFSLVKSGVAFRVENKRGGVVFFRPFRNYRYPLAKAVRTFWTLTLEAELKSRQDGGALGDIQEGLDRLFRILRHDIRVRHGYPVYTEEQMQRDLQGDYE